MPEIHILDKAVAELIAAGEVVERPASIVKELLENSIDAGATDISVEISGGGVRMIRVSDNGCGISREDIPKAFLRHATSKVCKAEDLDGILTLGFRGEALASVAAMCRVELLTRAAYEDEGTSYRVEGGEVCGCAPAGRPVGTTVTVRDVFFNTPARMKFLKKDVSEGNSVAQVVDKCAFSHPEIAFRFVRDGTVKLKTSGNGDLLAVIYEVYGREFANEMLAVEYVYENFTRVSGYISQPGRVKPSRAYQNFFINGRFVKTRTGAAALEEAYKNRIMTGKFPACFLNLELDAATVDVNVHPAKTEVRFVNERPVFSAVYYAVKSALSTLETPIGARASVPEPQRVTAREFRELFAPDEPESNIKLEYKPLYTSDNFAVRPVSMRSSMLDISVDDDADLEKFARKAGFAKIMPDSGDRIFEEIARNEPRSATTSVGVVSAPAHEAPEPRDFRVIGEAFGTYIILEQDDRLVLVDKHAAHERLIYERIKSTIDHGCRQVLLAPQSVALSREEHSAIVENPEEAEKIGFLVEDFGGNAVVVREVPVELSESDVAFVIREIAAKLAAGSHDLTPAALDRLYYSIACRSAVKARDKNSEAELAEIVRRLRENPEITHCPHGRPVMVALSGREIEKMFGRLG